MSQSNDVLPDEFITHDSEYPQTKPSSALLNAALIGFFGAGIGACGTKETEKIVVQDPPAPTFIGEAEDRTFTLAEFTAFCDARGGLVQTHASCGGVNSCRGTSFSYGKLREHTCKGINTCAGMSCVDLPEDSGLKAEDILTGVAGSDVKCSWCHSASGGHLNHDGEHEIAFKLPVAPGTADTDEKKAQIEAEFLSRSAEYQVNVIAFGLHGTNANGTAYANMPAYHLVYSKAEIERLVDYIRSLDLVVEEWTNPE